MANTIDAHFSPILMQNEVTTDEQNQTHCCVTSPQQPADNNGQYSDEIAADQVLLQQEEIVKNQEVVARKCPCGKRVTKHGHKYCTACLKTLNQGLNEASKFPKELTIILRNIKPTFVRFKSKPSEKSDIQYEPKRVIIVKNFIKPTFVRFKSEPGEKSDISDEVKTLNLKLDKHWVQKAQLYECLLCDEKRVRKSCIRDHVRRHLGVPSRFRCQVCSKDYDKHHLLEQHMFIHTALKWRYKCEKCQKTFFYKSSFSDHVCKDKPSSDKSTLCDICGKSFHGLKQHMQNIHSNIKYECKLCNKFYKSKDYLSRHMNTRKHQKGNDLDRPEELTINQKGPI